MNRVVILSFALAIILSTILFVPKEKIEQKANYEKLYAELKYVSEYRSNKCQGCHLKCR